MTHNLKASYSLLLISLGLKDTLIFISRPASQCHKVQRVVLKTEGEARGFQPSRRTLWMLMNDKIMFDRYYCINSTKHCKNEENIVTLYFITSSHFPTELCMIRAAVKYS